MKNTTTKIITLFVILVAAFVIYSYWGNITNYVNNFFGSANTKIFKIAGNDIGPYLQGDNVMAEKDTFSKRNPQVGEVVVYEKTVNGKPVDTMGRIVGLPGSTIKGKYAPAGYYIIQKGDLVELVLREKITWLIFRKVQ